METKVEKASTPQSVAIPNTTRLIPIVITPLEQVRNKKLSQIKARLEQEIQVKIRKQQSRALHLLNLAVLIVISSLNAYILIDLSNYSNLRISVLLGIVLIGMIFSIVSNLLITSWQEVLKLYVLLDSVVPVTIASIIGFFAILNFSSTGDWNQTCMAVIFPIWVVYLAGHFRVMIAHAAWSRLQVVTTKLVLLSSGLIFFYVGFTYMRGGYKITQGLLVQFENRFRDMIYLYVFGIVELFFEYYRRLSYFDQTEELKYEYKLRDQSEEQKKNIIEAQLKLLELQMLKDQLRLKLQNSSTLKSISSLSKSNSRISSRH